nr:immunoglobulin heavy chain junction region [Macaca mulatta]MOV39705.1 immunoglobulin heavy chain junction region [Macaca mulatta]MOV40272.1 immunoglobulin heavy chain junction region [Macaca mulatta]MOV40330.1 immunoglobulin heavy chain junction region [Macaca mulatta]MOV40935.1 immunoglobulin heavy chain junction region [Macaca mulatta]
CVRVWWKLGFDYW